MRGPRAPGKARPSPARVPRAGPERPLPVTGEVTRSCPFSPTREKVAEGRMRGPRPAASHATTQPSPARGPRAGPERPLPVTGEVTRSCPFSPTREKVAEGRMSGPRAPGKARPSPAQVPRAGPERPLPVTGEVTRSCPFSPTREKVAAGRMRGTRRAGKGSTLTRPRDPGDTATAIRWSCAVPTRHGNIPAGGVLPVPLQSPRRRLCSTIPRSNRLAAPKIAPGRDAAGRERLPR